MKVSSSNNILPTNGNNNSTKNNTSFKGGAAIADTLVNFWQFIDNGGRALQFTAEDMTGTNIPRSIKGLLAGKKYTGHINLPAFFQEAIREFLTGPTMCIVPWVIISLAKKSGKTANTHRENIKNLSYLLENTQAQDAKNIEEAFYTTVARDMLNKSTGKEVSEEAVNTMVDLFKQLGDSQKDKKAQKRILNEMQTFFENVVKNTKDSYKKTDFLAAKYSTAPNKESATKLKNYADYTVAYIKDFTKKFGGDISKENINDFKSTWLGKRLIVITGMIAITGILMSQIPKLYTMASGKVNPNASAIYDEAKKKQLNNAQQSSDTNNQETQKTNNKGQKIAKAVMGTLAGLAALTGAGVLAFKGKEKPQIVENALNKLSDISKGAGALFDKTAKGLGSLTGDSEFFDKVINHIEPTGANNSFIALATLMTATVIIPRVKTAAKRNPDNPEATKDEIKEILFRDVQTVLIVLFSLKAINSIVANATSKLSGLPMTNKPYDKIFSEEAQTIGQKASEFIAHPVQKLKTVAKNVLNTLHPTEGVRALTNEEYIAKYSNYSVDNFDKLLQLIEDEKGDKTKVFNKIINSVIDSQKTELKKLEKLIKSSLDKEGNPNKALADAKGNIEYVIKELEALKEKGPNGVQTIDDKNVKEVINTFLQDQDNSLVRGARRMNAILRTGALGFEATYLGFGLPAINQIRLEKKYLKNNKNNDTVELSGSDKSSGSLIGKNIKAHEVKLYHKFIK